MAVFQRIAMMMMMMMTMTMTKKYEHNTLILFWHAKPHPGCLSPTG